MLYLSIDSLIKIDPLTKPIIIPTFNNPYYLKRTIHQLVRNNVNLPLIIEDNNSTYIPMLRLLSYLATLKNFYIVMKQNNDGPRHHILYRPYFNWLPNIFLLTDPDLDFNKNLPNNFIGELELLSEKHKTFKSGFALDYLMEGQDLVPFYVRALEPHYWKVLLETTENGDDVFSAPIDTTFCLINKKFFMGSTLGPGLRVAGNYTASHLPWLKKPPVPLEEYLFYEKTVDHWASNIRILRESNYNRFS